METLPINGLRLDEELQALSLLPKPDAEQQQQLHDNLTASIAKHGITSPLVVRSGGRGRPAIIDGVARLAAAKDAGLQVVPVTYMKAETTAEAARARTELNMHGRQLNNWHRAKIAYQLISSTKKKRKDGDGDKWQDAADFASVSLGTMSKVAFVIEKADKYWSSAKAKEVFADLDAGKKTISSACSDIKGASNTKRTKSRPKREVNGKDANNDEQPKKARKQQTYTNKVINGDWIESMRQMPEDSVTLAVTSVPYLGAKLDYRGGFNDNMPYSVYLDWLKEGFTEILRTLRPGGMFACNVDSVRTSDEETETYYRFPVFADLCKVLQEVGFTYQGDIAWVKYIGKDAGTGAYGSMRIRRGHEYIIMASKGIAKIQNETAAKMDILKDEVKKWTYSAWTDIGPEQKHRKKADHPATFPVEIPHRLTKLFSFRGDVVLDPFCGTGTTLEAAKNNGRKFCGIELNRGWAEYAAKRVGGKLVTDAKEKAPAETPKPKKKAPVKKTQKKLRLAV